MENKKTNILAVVGFILSITTFIPGLIVSIIALSQIKKTGEEGKGFAIAGVIIGGIGSVLFILPIISIIFSLFAWPSIRQDIIDSSREHYQEVYCSHAFDCVEEDGQYECFYCEDESEDCEDPRTITCPID